MGSRRAALHLLFLPLLQFINGVLSQELVPALFIFGDSLIDAGNNNYIPSVARANYPPYGIDFGYPTGRFTNGLTVVDYAAMALGLPLAPAYLEAKLKGLNMLKGINFASAAAGILDETGANYVARITFNQQLALFEKTIGLEFSPFFQDQQELSDYLAKSIYMVVFGSNDYINNYLMPKLYPSSKLYDPHTYGQILVRVLTQQLKSLYSLGARKIVVVNVGPLGCMPSQIARADTNGQCVDRVNQEVMAFNTQLFELVKKINSTLPGSIFVHYNVYDVFMDIADNPSKYGKFYLYIDYSHSCS
ncbi:unnamed protein product [Victoria cruziana]